MAVLATRGLSAWIAALATLAGVVVAVDAQAATPPLTWQGVTTLQVLCLIDPATLPARDALQKQMCEDVRRLAAQGAPIPVKILAPGDPALIEPGTATLLVHGNVERVAAQNLFLFHVRLFRPARLEAETFFTAPPRALVLPSSGGFDGALRKAVASSLARILPWRRGH